jgi:hypothetical protein
MKTQEQKEQEAKKYLATASQHLFIVNDKFIYKIIEYEVDGKLNYAKLMVSPDNVTIEQIRPDRFKWDYKQWLFPQYVKTKSIPHFKKMKEVIALVKSEINLNDNKVLIEKIKQLAKEFELVKE